MFVSKLPMRVKKTVRVTLTREPQTFCGEGGGLILKVLSGRIAAGAPGESAVAYPMKAGDTLDCTGLTAVSTGERSAVLALLYYESL